MIKLTLTAQDLENLRFSYRPLNELTMSYHLLRQPTQTPSTQRWRADVLRAAHDVQFTYMPALILEHHYMADFLTPPPTTHNMTFEDEIATLRALDDAVIRASVWRAMEYQGESEVYQQFLAYPREMLECLIDELRFYWTHAVEPYWQRVLTVLENDVLYRAREMALHGVDATFSDLASNLRYEQHTLYIQSKCLKPDGDYTLAGDGVYLMPTAFKSVECALSWMVVPEYTPTLIYAARGGGNWYADTLPDPEAQLRAALGDAPARLLVALSEPDSTSSLARRLFLTPGAVSQQLKRLSQAGLVESQRSGYKVYYRLSERGGKLLDLFGG